VSTRLVGALIMAHGDDRGIVIPPRLASTQLVIVPIYRDDGQRSAVLDRVGRLGQDLDRVGFRVDDREQHSPGHKFNHWEQRGIPLRMEIGPKDLEKNQVVMVRRDTGEKASVSQEGLGDTVREMLDRIQAGLFARALEFRESRTYVVDDYSEFGSILDGARPGFIRSHWCGSGACEERVKTETKATIRCIPRNAEPETGACVVCGNRSERRVIFAHAY
jgi:prolyl-tRNA synthetase